jgi:hypothetical protein
MENCNYLSLMHNIDIILADLGSGAIADARKIRDQLLDLRLVCMTMDAEQRGERPIQTLPQL